MKKLNRLSLKDNLLFDNGHLSVNHETYNYRMKVGFVKLANLKIALICSRILGEVYIRKNDTSRSRIDSPEQSALNDLSQKTLNETLLERFLPVS